MLFRHARGADRILVYQPPSWEWHEQEAVRRAITPETVRAAWAALREMHARPKNEVHHWIVSRWQLDPVRTLLSTGPELCEELEMTPDQVSILLTRLKEHWKYSYHHRFYHIIPRVRPRSAADVLLYDLIAAVPPAPDGTRILRMDELRRMLGSRFRTQVTRLRRLGCLTVHPTILPLRISMDVPALSRIYWRARDVRSEWHHLRDLVDAAPLWEEGPIG